MEHMHLTTVIIRCDTADYIDWCKWIWIKQISRTDIKRSRKKVVISMIRLSSLGLEYGCRRIASSLRSNQLQLVTFIIYFKFKLYACAARKVHGAKCFKHLRSLWLGWRTAWTVWQLDCSTRSWLAVGVGLNARLAVAIQRYFKFVKPEAARRHQRDDLVACCMRFAFEMRLLEFNKNVLLSHKNI